MTIQPVSARPLPVAATTVDDVKTLPDSAFEPIATTTPASVPDMPPLTMDDIRSMRNDPKRTGAFLIAMREPQYRVERGGRNVEWDTLVDMSHITVQTRNAGVAARNAAWADVLEQDPKVRRGLIALGMDVKEGSQWLADEIGRLGWDLSSPEVIDMVLERDSPETAILYNKLDTIVKGHRPTQRSDTVRAAAYWLAQEGFVQQAAFRVGVPTRELAEALAGLCADLVTMAEPRDVIESTLARLT